MPSNNEDKNKYLKRVFGSINSKIRKYVDGDSLTDYANKRYINDSVYKKLNITTGQQHNDAIIGIKDELAQDAQNGMMNKAVKIGAYPDYSDQGMYMARAQQLVGMKNDGYSYNVFPQRVGVATRVIDKVYQKCEQENAEHVQHPSNLSDDFINANYEVQTQHNHNVHIRAIKSQYSELYQLNGNFRKEANKVARAQRYMPTPDLDAGGDNYSRYMNLSQYRQAMKNYLKDNNYHISPSKFSKQITDPEDQAALDYENKHPNLSDKYVAKSIEEEDHPQSVAKSEALWNKGVKIAHQKAIKPNLRFIHTAQDHLYPDISQSRELDRTKNYGKFFDKNPKYAHALGIRSGKKIMSVKGEALHLNPKKAYRSRYYLKNHMGLGRSYRFAVNKKNILHADQLNPQPQFHQEFKEYTKRPVSYEPTSYIGHWLDKNPEHAQDINVYSGREARKFVKRTYDGVKDTRNNESDPDKIFKMDQDLSDISKKYNKMNPNKLYDGNDIATSANEVEPISAKGFANRANAFMPHDKKVSNLLHPKVKQPNVNTNHRSHPSASAKVRQQFNNRNNRRTRLLKLRRQKGLHR